MDKITKIIESLSGGMGKVTGHVDNMVRGLEKALNLSNQIGNFNLGGANGAGGGDFSVGAAGGMMKPPSFGGMIVGAAGRASVMAAGAGFAAMQGAFPGMKTGTAIDAAMSRVGAFTGMGTYSVRGISDELNQRGLPINNTDAITALLEARSRGVRLNDATYSSIVDMSNLTPGLGVGGAMQVRGVMNAAQGVNRARMLGINLRDQITGKQTSFESQVNQVFELLKKMDGGKAPSREKILQSYQPGFGLWNLLHDLFGDDELTISQVLNGLLAKAAGAKDFSEGEMRRLGFATPAQQALGRQQGLAGEAAMTLAPGLAGIKEFITQLINNLVSSLINTDFFRNLFNQGIEFRHHGGKAEKGKPYIVGEQEAELFIPTETGIIVPGQKGGSFDKRGWASKFLSGINAPISDSNLEVMLRWMAQEGGHENNTAYFNPLNTTKSMPGEMGTMGTQGNVRRYTSWNMGMDASLKTINNGLYRNIIDAFRSNASKEEIYQAIVSSDWGTKNLPYKGSSGLFDASKYGHRSSGGTAITNESYNASVSGNPFAANATNPHAVTGAVNYGGVNINITLPNGATMSARDLIAEIKKQLSYDALLNIVRAS